VDKQVSAQTIPLAFDKNESDLKHSFQVRKCFGKKVKQSKFLTCTESRWVFVSLLTHVHNVVRKWVSSNLTMSV